MLDINAIKAYLMPYLESLKAFNFTYNNPLFWVGVLLLLLILSRFWQTKSAFSFSVLIALILLGTTKLESVIRDMLLRNGSTFDPTLVRILSGFVIAIIFVYYAFMKEA